MHSRHALLFIYITNFIIFSCLCAFVRFGIGQVYVMNENGGGAYAVLEWELGDASSAPPPPPPPPAAGECPLGFIFDPDCTPPCPAAAICSPCPVGTFGPGSTQCIPCAPGTSDIGE
jgi:hypothetical protein